MAKMMTIKHIATGELDLGRNGDVARIERNLFAENGDTFEALRFCKSRNGRHNRVHLVIPEDRFVELFADAVKKQVFSEASCERLLEILGTRTPGKPSATVRSDADDDPFLKVIGIGSDGHLSENIDEELYG